MEGWMEVGAPGEKRPRPLTSSLALSLARSLARSLALSPSTHLVREDAGGQAGDQLGDAPLVALLHDVVLLLCGRGRERRAGACV